MSHHQRIFKSYETSVYVCVYVYTHTYTYLFPQHFCSSSSVHYPYAELLPYPSNPKDSPSNSRFLIFFLITLLCLSLKTLFRCTDRPESGVRPIFSFLLHAHYQIKRLCAFVKLSDNTISTACIILAISSWKLPGHCSKTNTNISSTPKIKCKSSSSITVTLCKYHHNVTYVSYLCGYIFTSQM